MVAPTERKPHRGSRFHAHLEADECWSHGLETGQYLSHRDKRGVSNATKKQSAAAAKQTFSASADASNNGRWNCAGAATARDHVFCQTLLGSCMRDDKTNVSVAAVTGPSVVPVPSAIGGAVPAWQSLGECHRTKSIKSQPGLAACGEAPTPMKPCNAHKIRCHGVPNPAPLAKP